MATDSFTKYSVMVVTRSIIPDVSFQILLTHIILKYGRLASIVPDQERNVAYNITYDIHAYITINRLVFSAHYPQSSSIAETTLRSPNPVYRKTLSIPVVTSISYLKQN